MKKRTTTIECYLNKNISVKLENLQEVYGHDDSLPFNADVYVWCNEWGLPCLTKIATAWNDGWGGPTCVQPCKIEYREIFDKLNEYLKDNFEINCGSYKWDVDLEYLVSSLACYGIDGNVRIMSIAELDDCQAKC